MIRLADSFDHYNTARELRGKWPTGTGGAFVPGAHGQGLQLTGTEYAAATVEPAQTWYIRDNIRLPSSHQESIITLRDAGQTQITLYLDNYNRLVIYGGLWNELAGPSSFSIDPDTTYRLELKAHIAPEPLGSVEVRIDGTTITDLSASGIDTQSTTHASADELVLGGGGEAIHDDVLMLDEAGSRNNTWAGEGRIIAVLPAAPGAYQDWTASSGTPKECVDEPAADGDSSYIYATAAARVLFTMAPAPAGTVAAVQLVTVARKAEEPARTIRPLTRIDASDYQGSPAALTLGYQSHIAVMEVRPDDGTPWTPAAITAAQWGARLGTSTIGDLTGPWSTYTDPWSAY